MEIALIAAVASGGVIGRGGDLPWRLPLDLAHFRRLTTGHPILMGRRTWDSIGVPLPKRRSIVVTGQPSLDVPEAVIVVHSLRAAVDAARGLGASTAFVIGGAAIYAEALPLAQRLYLTRVHAQVEGDVCAPELEAAQLAPRFEKIGEEPHPADERHAHAFAFEEWVRSGPPGE